MTPEEIKEIESVVCNILHVQCMKKIFEDNKRFEIEVECFTSLKFILILSMIIFASLVIGYIIGVCNLK